MQKIQLKDKLQQLHIELQQTESVDEKSKVLLEKLEKDIQQVLDRSDDESWYGELFEKLEDEVEDLEETHPSIFTAIKNITTTLSNIGI